MTPGLYSPPEMADDDGVIGEAENCVWYKLNVDTRTATILHEEPIGGDWGSLRKVTKSKLILFNRNESDTTAKSIFSCTSRVSNDYILKPLMVTWNKNKKLWIIFYPSFTEFLCWWESKSDVASKSISKLAELQFWLVKFARRILKALIQAHAQGVAHGNLSDQSNYAIVGERRDEKLVLTNLSVRRGQDCRRQVVESGGKNIEVAVMTKDHGLRKLEEAEIDAIVADIEAEKAAAEAAKKGPARET